MDCNDPVCGGKSDTAQICKNNSGNGNPCQCQIGITGAPAPTNTEVTATNSAGSTIVGVYNLITIDKYKSLRQQQTVTFMQTTTGTDGKQTVAAAAAVVAAGGVAWILGTGADAAGAALLQAPEPPEANKDDPQCPAQKHECKDCGGLPGINICVAPDGGCGCEPEEQCPTGEAMPKCSDTDCVGQDSRCTVGKHNGCACKSCPTGDQQPQCDDEQKCNGKDGKCTLGDNNRCQCKENPCPEKRYTPFCDFCGDKGSDGKCKGIADKNNLWMGCECWDEPPNPVEWPREDQSIMNFDPESLPKISPSSYSYGGDDPLKCQDLSYDAKRDDLKESIAEWCKSVDSKEVTKSGDTDFVYKRFDYDYYSYWLAAGYDGALGGNCGDKAKVTEINCVSTMLEELDDCNIGQDRFKGAELTDGCVRYQITFSRSKNDHDPPFKQLAQESPDCAKGDDDVSPVTYKFWKGVSKKFCNEVGDGKSAKKADLKNTDLQTRSIFARTPPPSDKAYPDWKFHFEWEPKGGHYGGQQNSMVKKGSIEVGCGKYSYSLEGPPEASTPAPPKQPAGPIYAGCHIWFSLFFWRFGVTFFTDENKLHDEIKGCGAETNWKIEEEVGDRKYVTFNLPLAMKDGCVERAIKTATGKDTMCLPKNNEIASAQQEEIDISQQLTTTLWRDPISDAIEKAEALFSEVKDIRDELEILQ
ncbi:hypothetical protein N0V90_007634 [Kalmusia sp. IMI 367209]|nr:hypothetical protein N0V90_007634 [Kalmusia sp. IMI 367209]